MKLASSVDVLLEYSNIQARYGIMAICPYCGSDESYRSGKRKRASGEEVQCHNCKRCGTRYTENALPSGNQRDAGFCKNHPHKKAHSHGLCQACYRKARRAKGKDKNKKSA